MIAITINDFYDLPETTDITEFINGEIVVTPAPKDKHQACLGQVYLQISKLELGGVLRFSPADLQLGNHGVQPDLFWIADDNTSCVLTNERVWQGAPNLIAEVVSPSTAKRDRDDKFHIYEANSVPEYWLIEPEAQFIEVYVLENSRYQRQGVYDTKDSFISKTLNNQTITVSKLFEA